jgi:AcrR family transcriptional regulator
VPRRKRGETTEPGSELGPLPGGHHGLSPEQVAESQRERLLAAIVEVVGRQGYREATITEIVKAASVSTRAFYVLFESKEDCFLAAFDAVVDHLHELVADASRRPPDWPHKVVAALRAVLDFYASEPDLARLCLIEPAAATSRIAIRFREAVVACIPYLKLGRSERDDAIPLPDSTEDSLLGGLIALVSRSILSGSDRLEELLPDVVEFVLAPYLGPEDAKALAAEAAGSVG